MLVLSRRVGEEIVIDGNIRITVVALRGQQVRLGITAPKSVAVAREELLDRSVECAARAHPEESSLALSCYGGKPRRGGA
jgi:carbon storage regulator